MRPQNLTIGIIHQTPDVGGAETYMHLLVKEFHQQNAELLLATNLDKFITLLQPLPVTLFRIPVILDVIGNYRGLIKSILLLPYAVLYYLKLLRTFRKHKCDVILMSGFSEKMLVTLLARFFNIPVVWIEHGPLSPIFPRNFYLPKLLYRFCERYASHILASSNHTRSSLLTDASIKPNRVTTVYVGVPVPKALPVRKQSQKKVFLIGNISRLTREKGQQYLIEAMPHILKKIPHARLRIIGQGPDKAYFQSLVHKLKIEQAVEFTDYVPDIQSHFNQMDVFVFPTVWGLEGFGMVTAEAMSHGVPVIGSNLGPVPEIVENERSGLLVEPGNSTQIAEAVIRLYQEPRLATRLREAGYQRIQKHFQIEETSKLVYQYLRNATKKTIY